MTPLPSSRPQTSSTVSRHSTAAVSWAATRPWELNRRVALAYGRRRSTLPSMTRAFLLAGIVLIVVASPRNLHAQGFDAVRTQNALNDMARAHRDQAESLRRIETIQRDQARADDRARRNAERDSRSMRRFDRP